MISFLNKLLSPKVLTITSLSGSAVAVGAGFIDGQPFSTLSFVGLVTSLTAASVYAALIIADIKARLDALDGKKEA